MSARTRINVGAAPSVFRATAVWLDGESAALRPVELRLDDEGRALVIGATGVRWAYDRLRALPDLAGGDQMVLRSADDPVARVIVSRAEDARVIATRATALARVPRATGLGRISAAAVAAVVSVLLIVFLLVPALADRLAGFLPPEGERALGEATFGQIRTALADEMGMPLALCDAPEGRAALDRIGARLTAVADLPVPLTLEVLDDDMVNAFALPGGYVVFFDGLIREAARPEEVAAVFAHEMGHVAARDPTRIALRSAGSLGVLGLLFGDFAGGALVLLLTNQLIAADYTREAEAAADAYAHDLLLRADLPPDAIATLFERLAAEEGEPSDFEQHFLSHPAIGDRIAAARAAMPDDAAFEPLLTDEEWAALQGICAE
ncbi:M48 family metallopeptidase [Histidinibacterium lentulum]|uniref:Peptidase M48 Ste24p n=1 Tax=Histidinibacterium lentulum TaxID=2480588 RepID=A0A3N2R5K1_9RHOB|nr:M48 family metallopeptidase [Histidinibacterium lentulum]ROU02678.1 peptidase M48 Ste24p [Histidinibacterium lentulum]